MQIHDCLFFDGVVAFQSFELAVWYIPAKEKLFSGLRPLITGVWDLKLIIFLCD